MEKTRGKLIIGSFRGGNGETPQHKPSMDRSVGLPISPSIIQDCVLRGCDCEFSVHHESQLESADLIVQDARLTRKHENYVWLADVAWPDNTCDEDGERLDYNDSFGYVLEIHINGVYMFAKISETLYTDYERIIDEEVIRRAQEAFILASALIGVSVRRGLIIGDPKGYL
jgi:hypothetical protein